MSLSYQEFKAKAAELASIDLSAYKSQQMDRRLHALMHMWGASDYDAYLSILQTDEPRLHEFQQRLTINVSEFFRNPERFTELAEHVLPVLFRAGKRLRIWSAGCANGAEPYTVAMIIQESGYQPGVEIIGSDIDKDSLKRAASGLYNANEVRSVPRDFLDKYFRQRENDFHLADPIKRMVIFKRENLLYDDYEHECNLILCRNVVIYLTESAKNRLYHKFLRALVSGGYLMVGGTEPLLNYREFGLENTMTAFYRKVGK